MYSPSGHEAVCEVEGEVSRTTTLFNTGRELQVSDPQSRKPCENVDLLNAAVFTHMIASIVSVNRSLSSPAPLPKPGELSRPASASLPEVAKA